MIGAVFLEHAFANTVIFLHGVSLRSPIAQISETMSESEYQHDRKRNEVKSKRRSRILTYDYATLGALVKC